MLSRLELVLGDGVTFGDALQTVGKEILGSKFKGVLDEAEKLSLKPGEGALINKPRNQHWIAQFRDENGKVHTFDSYGRKMGPNPVPEIKGFVQHGKEQNCGPRSLAYLCAESGGAIGPKLKTAAKTAAAVAGVLALQLLSGLIANKTYKDHPARELPSSYDPSFRS